MNEPGEQPVDFAKPGYRGRERGGQIAGECQSGSCVTCSDEALLRRILRLLPGELALVDAGGRTDEVSVALVEATAGATVLVHAKEALAVIGDVDD